MPSLPPIAARVVSSPQPKPRPRRSRLRAATFVVSVLLAVPSVLTVVVVMMKSLGEDGGYHVTLRRREASGDDAARLTSEETALIPPPSYPWHRGHGRIDVDSFLRRVEGELNSDEIGPRSLLYLVRRDGGLWIRSSHHRLVKKIDHGLYYHFRVRPFEEMVSRALDVARRSATLNPEISQAVLGPDFGAEVALPILFQWNDYGGCVDNDGYPIFAYAMPYPPPGRYIPPSTSDADAKVDCLTFAIPGYDAWRKYGSDINPTFRWDATHRRNDASFPWTSKIARVVWRGSSTGSVHDYPNWREMPRARLVLAGMERPDVFDVGFTSIVQRNDSEVRSMKEELGGGGRGGLKGTIPFRGFMRYRAVLDIDGNSWSTRFADLLCQNSVVVKVEPSYAEYFFRELRPWVHYVPVSSNLSDLVEVGTYVVSDANQGRMKQIVRAANGWCAEKITSSRMVVDTMWILRSYAEALEDGGGSGSRGDDGVGEAEDWRRRLEGIWARWVHGGSRRGGGGADDGGGMIKVGERLSMAQEVAAIVGIYVLRPLLGMDPFWSVFSSTSFRWLLCLGIVLPLFLFCRSFAALLLSSRSAILGGGRKNRTE